MSLLYKMKRIFWGPAAKQATQADRVREARIGWFENLFVLGVGIGAFAPVMPHAPIKPVALPRFTAFNFK